MTAGILWFGDRDASTDFGVSMIKMQGFPGMLAGAPVEVSPVIAPERPGGFLDPNLLQPRPARCSIDFFFGNPVSHTATMVYLDALKALFRQGQVPIRTVFAPDRQCLATLESLEGDLAGVSLDGRVNNRMTFVVESGLALRIAPDIYALSSTRKACPTGTFLSRPVIVVHGNGGTLTGPIVITRRNSAGVSVQTMTLSTTSLGSGVLGANDYLLIDSARTAITKSLAGTKTDAHVLWTAGDFLVLHHDDAVYEESAWQTVELSAASGTAVGQISYERRYR